MPLAERLPQIAAEGDTARARRSDEETSHAAADSNTNREAVEAAVLALFVKHGPMTDFEVTTRYFADLTHPEADFESPRKRRSDLAKRGELIATTTRRPGRSGRASVVWALA